MELIFGKATTEQHDRLYQLMLDAFTPYVIKLDGGSVSGPYPHLATEIENGNIFVALDNKEIVGLVTTIQRDKELHIDQLGVDPERQGQGIGSFILKELESAARQNQIALLSLQTAEIRTDLLRLYTRHGFVETHRALPHHGDDEYLRVHMEKSL